jgi:hypothetical protein
LDQVVSELVGGWFLSLHVKQGRMNRGEGEFVEENPKIILRKRASQSKNMASEEGLSNEEKEFRKTFFAMSEMMKVLYEDYLE